MFRVREFKADEIISAGNAIATIAIYDSFAVLDENDNLFAFERDGQLFSGLFRTKEMAETQAAILNAASDADVAREQDRKTALRILGAALDDLLSAAEVAVDIESAECGGFVAAATEKLLVLGVYLCEKEDWPTEEETK